MTPAHGIFMAASSTGSGVSRIGIVSVFHAPIKPASPTGEVFAGGV